MKIITLIENTTNDSRLSHEHGLSIYFEQGASKYLLDVGQSDKFIHNAEVLGVNLEDIDHIIISHNHYDHIGGLTYLLEINHKAKVYIRREAFGASYYRLGLLKKKLSYDERVFDRYKDRIVYIDNDISIDNVHIMSVPNPDSRYISQDRELYMSKGAQYIQDNFRHELFVAICKDKITILSSCSHNGIINIINKVKGVFNKPIDNIIGGLHMIGTRGINTLNCSNEFIQLTAKSLLFNVYGRTYTGHCTGLKAYSLLKKLMGDKIEYLDTGTIIEIN